MSDIDELLKEAPTLTFDPLPDTAAQTPAESGEQKADAAQQEIEKVQLTPEEQKMVDDFSAQIDITNTQAVLQYGAGCQKKIADFSESALSNVRTKDMGEVGEMLTQVVAELKSIDDEEDNKGFFGMFKTNFRQPTY